MLHRPLGIHPQHVMAQPLGIGLVQVQKRLDQRTGHAATGGDPLIHEVGVKETTAPQDRLGVVVRIPACLQIVGKSIKIRAQRPSAEIDQGPSFFIKVFQYGRPSLSPSPVRAHAVYQAPRYVQEDTVDSHVSGRRRRVSLQELHIIRNVT